jgi:hypothetical protein
VTRSLGLSIIVAAVKKRNHEFEYWLVVALGGRTTNIVGEADGGRQNRAWVKYFDRDRLGHESTLTLEPTRNQ